MESQRQLQLPTWDMHGPTRRRVHDAERTVKQSVSNPGTRIWGYEMKLDVKMTTTVAPP